MNKIKRLTGVLKALLIAGAVAVITGVISTLFDPALAVWGSWIKLSPTWISSQVLPFTENISIPAFRDLAGWQIAAHFAFTAGLQSVLIVMGVCLWKLMKLFNQGHFFEVRNVQLLRKCGWLLLLWEALHPVWNMLSVLVLTILNPIGQRTISLIVSLNEMDFTVIFIALFIILISTIWQRAAIMNEEQQFTV